MIESIQITLERYKNKKGNPICAYDFETGEICRFLQTIHFGIGFTCLFAPSKQRLKRQNGFLVPGNWCLLWDTPVILI